MEEQVLDSEQQEQQQQVSWTDFLNEDDKALLEVKGWKTPADITKSYKELEKYMGHDKIPAPKKGPDGNYEPGEFERIMTVLGLPKDSKGYELPQDFKAPIDEVKLQLLKDEALKQGLLPKQFQFVMDKYQQLVNDSQKLVSESQEKSYHEAMLNLKQKWGMATDQKIAMVNKMLNEFSGDDATDFIKEFGNNPKAIELLANIADNLSEEALQKTNLSGTMLTPEIAKMEITKLRAERAAELMDGSHPQHKYYQEKLDSLYKMAHPKTS